MATARIDAGVDVRSGGVNAPSRAPASLFRTEALAEQDGTLHGSTATTLGPGPRKLTALALLVALAIVIFAFWGRYTRSEHVTGTLEPSRGLVRIQTPQTGVVTERRVREGQMVHRGDVLLVLSSDRVGLHAGEAQADVIAQLDQRRDSLLREREAQAQIDMLAIQALDARRRGLHADIDSLSSELQLQRQRVALAAATVARHRELVARQFETAAALQPYQEAELEQGARLAQTERALAGLQRDLQSTEPDLDAARLRRANNASGLDRQRAELAQQRTEAEMRRNVVITAPADGQVTALVVDIGQTADPAAVLMLLLPRDSALQATLWLPSRAIGFVHPRQSVRLRYQAFPYQHFGQHDGRVVEISRAPIYPVGTGDAARAATGEAMYRVTVELPAQQLSTGKVALPLQAGMALDADIRVDSRRLIDWLIDPLRPPQPPST